MLARVLPRITRQLTRDGVLVEDPEQPYLDLTLNDTLDAFAAASIQYQVILGPGAGNKTLTLHAPKPPTTPTHKPLTTARDGFSLNASVACEPWQRQRLERLTVDDTGRLRYALKHPYRDGTTHFLFHPLDLLARLAALIPRPRVNLTRYHGVFAPHSKHTVVSLVRVQQAEPFSTRHQYSRNGRT